MANFLESRPAFVQDVAGRENIVYQASDGTLWHARYDSDAKEWGDAQAIPVEDDNPIFNLKLLSNRNLVPTGNTNNPYAPGLMLLWQDGIDNGSNLYYSVGRFTNTGDVQWSDAVLIETDEEGTSIADENFDAEILVTLDSNGKPDPTIAIVEQRFNSELLDANGLPQDDPDLYFITLKPDEFDLVFETPTTPTAEVDLPGPEAQLPFITPEPNSLSASDLTEITGDGLLELLKAEAVGQSSSNGEFLFLPISDALETTQEEDFGDNTEKDLSNGGFLILPIASESDLDEAKADTAFVFASETGSVREIENDPLDASLQPFQVSAAPGIYLEFRLSPDPGGDFEPSENRTNLGILNFFPSWFPKWLQITGSAYGQGNFSKADSEDSSLNFAVDFGGSLQFRFILGTADIESENPARPIKRKAGVELNFAYDGALSYAPTKNWAKSAFDNKFTVGADAFYLRGLAVPGVASGIVKIEGGAFYIRDWKRTYDDAEGSLISEPESSNSFIEIITKDGTSPVPATTSLSDIDLVFFPDSGLLFEDSLEEDGSSLNVTNSVLPYIQATARLAGPLGFALKGAFRGYGQIPQDLLGLSATVQARALTVTLLQLTFKRELDFKNNDQAEFSSAEELDNFLAEPELKVIYAPLEGTSNSYATKGATPVPANPAKDVTKDLLIDGPPSLEIFTREGNDELLLAWSKGIEITTSNGQGDKPPSSFIQLNLASPDVDTGLSWQATKSQLELDGLPIQNQGQQNIATQSSLNSDPVLGTFGSAEQKNLTSVAVWIHQDATNITNQDNTTLDTLSDVLSKTEIRYSYLPPGSDVFNNWTEPASIVNEFSPGAQISGLTLQTLSDNRVMAAWLQPIVADDSEPNEDQADNVRIYYSIWNGPSQNQENAWSEPAFIPRDLAWTFQNLGASLSDADLNRLIAGDFDGDGFDDLLKQTSEGGQLLLSNQYNGSFTTTAKTESAFALSNIPLYGGDFDGNGMDGLLQQSSTADTLELFSSNLDTESGFNLPQTITVEGLGTASEASLAIGDFNGDGLSDFLRQDTNEGTLQPYVADVPTSLGTYPQLIWNSSNGYQVKLSFDGKDNDGDGFIRGRGTTVQGEDGIANEITDWSMQVFKDGELQITYDWEEQQSRPDFIFNFDISTGQVMATESSSLIKSEQTQAENAAISKQSLNIGFATGSTPNNADLNYNLFIAGRPNILLSQIPKGESQQVISETGKGNTFINDVVTFRPVSGGAVDALPESIVEIGDFNGDGFDDVLVDNKTGQNLILYLANPDVPGTFNAGQNTSLVGLTPAKFAETTGQANPFNGFVAEGGYSTPTFGDLDGDLDLDAVIGSESGVLTYFKNTGSDTEPIYVEQTGSDNPFNDINTNKVRPRDIAPFLVDINGDTLLDAVVGNFSGTLTYYKNTGTAKNPTYEEQTGSNDPFNGVAVNTVSSSPTFADIDGDGDFDLLVGGEGYYTNNTYSSALVYYKNTGDKLNPKFTKQTGNDSPFTSINLDNSFFSYPNLADVDGDGDFDLLFGSYLADINSKQYGGQLIYYKNTGTKTQPTFVEQTGSESPFADIDVTSQQTVSPALVNTNTLVIGNDNGTLDYIKRSPALPTYTPGDLNADGITDLIRQSIASTPGGELFSTTALIANGDGTFRPRSEPITLSESSNPATIIGGNFDGGADDFIAQGATSSDVTQTFNTQINRPDLNLGLQSGLLDDQPTLFWQSTVESSYVFTVNGDSPLLYYRLSDLGSTTATNIGTLGNGYDGTYNGTLSQGKVGALVPGDYDFATEFSDGTLTIDNSLGGLPTDTFSLEFWANFTDSNGSVTISQDWDVVLTPDTLSATLTGTSPNAQANLSLPLDQWHHVVVTYQPAFQVSELDENGTPSDPVSVPSTLALYVDAQLVATKTNLDWTGTGKNLTLTAKGAILDELAIYDSALTGDGTPLPTVTNPTTTLESATQVNNHFASQLGSLGAFDTNIHQSVINVQDGTAETSQIEPLAALTPTQLSVERAVDFDIVSASSLQPNDKTDLHFILTLDEQSSEFDQGNLGKEITGILLTDTTTKTKWLVGTVPNETGNLLGVVQGDTLLNSRDPGVKIFSHTIVGLEESFDLYADPISGVSDSNSFTVQLFFGDGTSSDISHIQAVASGGSSPAGDFDQVQPTKTQPNGIVDLTFDLNIAGKAGQKIQSIKLEQIRVLQPPAKPEMTDTFTWTSNSTTELLGVSLNEQFTNGQSTLHTFAQNENLTFRLFADLKKVPAIPTADTLVKTEYIATIAFADKTTETQSLNPIGADFVVANSVLEVEPTELADIDSGVILTASPVNNQGKLIAGGYSVGQTATAGDFDGDGIADVALGVPGYANKQGGAFILFGPVEDALDLTPRTPPVDGDNKGVWIQGFANADGYGIGAAYSLASGNIDGDNLADLVIGAPYADVESGDNKGKVYVVYGKTLAGLKGKTLSLKDLTTAQGLIIDGQQSGEQFGFDVAVGDVDGQTKTIEVNNQSQPVEVDEIVVGAPFYSESVSQPDGTSSNEPIGRVYIYGDGISPTTPQVLFTGTPSKTKSITDPTNVQNVGSQVGFSVAISEAKKDSNGTQKNADFSGDGRADILIGSPYVYGTYSYSVPNQDILSDLGGTFSKFNSSLGQSNPNFNPQTGLATTYFRSGEAYVIYGASLSTLTNKEKTDLSGKTGVVFDMSLDSQGDVGAGYAVSFIGDVNGDGFDDAAVGAPYRNYNAGAVFIVNGRLYGGFTGNVDLSTQSDTTLFSKDNQTRTGNRVNPAGDVNSDGKDDFLVASPLAGYGAGKTHIVFGDANLAKDIELSPSAQNGTFVLNGGAPKNLSGQVAIGLGDVNKDTIDDVLVTAPQVGKNYVVYGKDYLAEEGSIKLSGLRADNGFAIEGNQSITQQIPRWSLFPAFVGTDPQGPGALYLSNGVDQIETSIKWNKSFGESLFDSLSLGWANLSNGQRQLLVLNDSTEEILYQSSAYPSGSYLSLATDGGLYIRNSSDQILVTIENGSASNLNFSRLPLKTTRLNAPNSLSGDDSITSYSSTNLAGLADVNGDGYDDILNIDFIEGAKYVSQQSAVVELGGNSKELINEAAFGLTTLTSAQTGKPIPATGGDVIGDFNADGIADILLTNQDSLTLTLGSPTALVEADTITPSELGNNGSTISRVARWTSLSLDGMGTVYEVVLKFEGSDKDGNGILTGRSNSSTLNDNIKNELTAWEVDVLENGDLLTTYELTQQQLVKTFNFNFDLSTQQVLANSEPTIFSLTDKKFGLNVGADRDAQPSGKFWNFASAASNVGGIALFSTGISNNSTELAATRLGNTDSTPSIFLDSVIDISPAGDVNGDGYADVAIIVDGAVTQITYVVYGNAEGSLPNDLASMSDSEGFSVFGTEGIFRSVTGAGDLNSDGFDDFAIGWTYEQTINGSPNVQNPANTTVILGQASRDNIDLGTLDSTTLERINAQGSQLRNAKVIGFDNSSGIAQVTDPQKVLQVTGSAHVDVYNWSGILGTAPRTVEAWIKTREGGTLPIVDWGSGPSNSGAEWAVRLISKNNVEVLELATNGGNVIGSTRLNDGQWHHIAVTLDSNGSTADLSQVKLYVDGVLEKVTTSGNTKSIDTKANPNNAVFIGRSIAAQNFIGEIDEVRIWSTARTQEQIQRNLYKIIDAGEANLEAYYTFDDDTYKDSSGKGRDGTPVSGPQIVDKWVANYASSPNIPRQLVAGLGDVNGDGFDDLALNGQIIRKSNAVPGFAPILEKYPGATITLLDNTFWENPTFKKGDYTPPAAFSVINRELYNTSFGTVQGAAGGRGFNLSKAGDINGDGFQDFILGETDGFLFTGTQEGADDSIAYSGRVAVIFGDENPPDIGPFTTLDPSQGFVIKGFAIEEGAPNPYTRAGTSVKGGGDINGDGFDDLLVTIPYIENPLTYVIFGADSSASVNQVGTPGNDDMEGTPSGDNLIGAAGRDLILGNGGADYIQAGLDDDFIAVADTNFRLVDGGPGFDAFQLAGYANQDYDLTSFLAEGRLRNIEFIDLNDYGNNTLTLPDTPLLYRLSDTSNTLLITGDRNDTVAFINPGTEDLAVVGGEQYKRFTIDNMTVLVEEDVQTTKVAHSTESVTAITTSRVSDRGSSTPSSNNTGGVNNISIGGGKAQLVASSPVTKSDAHSVEFVIERTGNLNERVVAEYYTTDLEVQTRMGEHYQPVAGILVFQPGETRKTISVPLINSDQPTFQRPQNIGLQLKQLEVLPGSDLETVEERRVELITPEGTVINRWQVIASPELEADNEQSLLSLDVSAQITDGENSLHLIVDYPDDSLKETDVILSYNLSTRTWQPLTNDERQFLDLDNDGTTDQIRINLTDQSRMDLDGETNGIVSSLITLARFGTTLLGKADEPNTLIGTAGNDVIKGGNKDDTLSGLAGNDSLEGGAGNDRLLGGQGTNTLTGGSGNDIFEITLGETAIITDFGGIGRGSKPTNTILRKGDTVKFTSKGLTAETLQLTQMGDDLELTFLSDDTDTKVILQDFKLENFDNLLKKTGANVDFDNITFVDDALNDSIDVFNAGSRRNRVWNRNSVTFLNDLNNRVRGISRSDDVMNGQGGDDTLRGLSGDDILRGGDGDDRLQGGRDDDILRGGLGNDTVIGGHGRDTFVLAVGDGKDTIQDFKEGIDLIGLADGLGFGQLSFSGRQIRFGEEVVAVLQGVRTEQLGKESFIEV